MPDITDPGTPPDNTPIAPPSDPAPTPPPTDGPGVVIDWDGAQQVTADPPPVVLTAYQRFVDEVLRAAGVAVEELLAELAKMAERFGGPDKVPTQVIDRIMQEYVSRGAMELVIRATGIEMLRLISAGKSAIGHDPTELA